MPYQIDICIPTLNEEKYIGRTLLALSQQTLYKRGLVQIIIGDYAPEGKPNKFEIDDIVSRFEYVKKISVFKKGIGYARNVTINNGISPYVVNFDADCRYNRIDALELLLKPLLVRLEDGSPETLMTNCDIVLDDAEKKNAQTDTFEDKLFTVASLFYRMFPISMGPCLMFSREAFSLIGGFRELPQNVPGEDWEFVFRFCQNFSIRAKKWVNDVVVIASNRRHKNLLKDPFTLDYSRQFR